MYNYNNNSNKSQYPQVLLMRKMKQTFKITKKKTLHAKKNLQNIFYNQYFIYKKMFNKYT